MINRAIFCGNLTRDAELRSTNSSTSVLQMTVAVNDRRKNTSTGEWEDYPNFIDCAFFGSRAEHIAHLLTKGTKVFVEGKLRYSQWDSNGVKKSKLSVVVDDIDFVTKDFKKPKAEVVADEYEDFDLPF